MYFFYLIFFFEELKLLTLSYRSVFYFKHQYGVIVGILLDLQGMQALLGMQSFLWIWS